ncbi:MAG: hypothetical protein QOH21_2742, partial [Acidobacteriota bacterium]|nr:hypothetical protein [Acidobacteriota bacterium]
MKRFFLALLLAIVALVAVLVIRATTVSSRQIAAT